MATSPARPDGLRQRKRQETRARIAEAGLRLFIADGYDATTIDAIAAAAGISRRTFFSYFTAKEEILLAWQSEVKDYLRTVLATEALDQPPLTAVYHAFLKIGAAYTTSDSIIIDRLMRSNETLLARKRAGYIQQEQDLLAVLGERWPDSAQQPSLRLVAMVAIGAMRLALDAWSQDGGVRPVTDYIRDMFTRLETDL